MRPYEFGASVTSDDRARPQRRSVRLPTWDYSDSGTYFVTLVVHNRHLLFGEVVDNRVRLSAAGRVAEECWLASAGIRAEIELDEFIVMPTHVHGIVWIHTRPEAETHDAAALIEPAPLVGAHGVRPPVRTAHPPLHRSPRSLGSFVAGFKASVTRQIRGLARNPDQQVWQRNYYERIIRDERELLAVREYIQNNPAGWADDPENPIRRPGPS